ncbi:MAG: hypothetical protein AAGF12_29550, partial [Myxococcota bacterium]
PERIPNFPLAGSVYYLRVREVAIAGEPPTENISDAYQISWDYAEVAPEDEAEVNDSLELATRLAIGETRSGYVGWAGDLDNYCLSNNGTNLRATVSGVPGVDLVLRVVDRENHQSRKIDHADIGAGEESALIETGSADSTCFEVSVDLLSDGEEANALDAYEFQVVVAEPPPETP